MLFVTHNLLYVPPILTKDSVLPLLKTQPNFKSVQGHMSTIGLPMSLVKNKSIVGGVTNPWKWYVDFYNTLKEKPNLLQLLGGDFKSVLHTLTHAIDVIPSPDVVVLWNATDKYDVYDDYMCSGLGYCSWLFKRTYKDTPDFYINLNKTQSGFDTLLCLPTTCKTIDTEYIKEYDDEMIGWVRFADSAYIHCFKWTMTETETLSLYVKEDMDFPYSFTF